MKFSLDYDAIADSHYKLSRGQVWCKSCGRTGFSTALNPNSSVAPYTVPPLKPPPAQLMGRPVDLATKKWLKPAVRDRILRDARVIYAA